MSTKMAEKDLVLDAISRDLDRLKKIDFVDDVDDATRIVTRMIASLNDLMGLSANSILGSNHVD